MDNLYGCGESTIRKYTLIVYKVLSRHDGLFGTYIHVSRGHRLANTKISRYHWFVQCGGCHRWHTYSFVFWPQRGLTPMPFDFFNRKNSIVCSCKWCAIRKGFSRMFVQNNLVEYIILVNLHGQRFIHNLEYMRYYLSQ